MQKTRTSTESQFYDSCFVYPIVPKRLNETGNPYIDDLVDCLEQSGVNVVNKADDRRNGVFSIFSYLMSTDNFYFNWIENLPQKKMGTIQVIVFTIQLIILKLFGKKIIWTLHNFDSHLRKTKLYDYLQSMMLRYSDIIILHSRESYPFLEKHKVDLNKTRYFFHPVKKNAVTPEESSQYIKNQDIDFLIWGAMSPYKGLDAFLEYCSSHNLDHKIFIAGKFKNQDFFHNIVNLKTSETIIKNEFISNEELVSLHKRARFVLFPYTGKSVLNSGALAFSLSMGTPIIGPNTGAFSELGKRGLIFTFSSFPEIEDIIKNNIKIDRTNLANFISDHSWENFGRSLKTWIKSNKK